jgi:hypothetical protein
MIDPNADLDVRFMAIFPPFSAYLVGRRRLSYRESRWHHRMSEVCAIAPDRPLPSAWAVRWIIDQDHVDGPPTSWLRREIPRLEEGRTKAAQAAETESEAEAT